MEACHYSYCSSTCFMQNYILSDCYIHGLEYPDTQPETRNQKMCHGGYQTPLSDLVNDDPL